MKKLRRILVVDGSRVVRATLAKHLQGEFEIIEEMDGESAWQTLMLDANIAAVISGLHTPKLEAHDLLARLRVSSMRRLRAIPFVLIVSDLDSPAEREFDRTCGVAGFISKSMKKSAIVDSLNHLLGDAPDSADAISEPVTALRVPAAAEAEAEAEVEAEAEAEAEAAEVVEAAVAVELVPPIPPPTAPTENKTSENDKLLASDRFDAVLAAISFAAPQVEDVCALVFGIDNHAQVIKSFGDEVAEVIAERFASLLIAKVGPKDSVGRWHGDQLAIISHGVDLKQGVHFGHRVCKSLASGQISIRGKKIRLTASVGVASSSDDDVSCGRELFSLAEQRLNQALVCGGNTVAAEVKPACPLHCQDSLTATLLDALSSQGEQKLSASIGSLGLKLLPLLQLMDKELSLDLPMEKMTQLLAQRAELEGVGS